MLIEKTINQKTIDHKPAPELLSIDDCPENVANSCNEYFTSLDQTFTINILRHFNTTKAALTTLKIKTKMSPLRSFYFEPTDCKEIEGIIINMKVDSAPGLDGISITLIIKLNITLSNHSG